MQQTHPSWIALVEVRGYSRGAQLSDLLRIERFVTRHVAKTGVFPTAWYVVNQFVGTDPDARPTALASNPQEVAAFRESGGLVVDTRELFILSQRAAVGQTPLGEARHHLRASAGIFRADAE